jgi:sulfite exporter TauE/SafE
MELGIVFLTGLTIGGLTCLAVQGGLLASVIASREKEGLSEKGKINPVFPTLAFLICKLIAYVLLGFILGLFGSAISLTSQVQSVIQLVAGIYMIIIALNLLDIHPIFRYAVIQPPRFLTKRIRNKSRSSDIFAPAMLGFMTIFIPCGTTLAMEALAISTASPIKGALILGTFVLGTFPSFIEYRPAVIKEAA